jgi:hypothetical protein
MCILLSFHALSNQGHEAFLSFIFAPFILHKGDCVSPKYQKLSIAKIDFLLLTWINFLDELAS